MRGGLASNRVPLMPRPRGSFAVALYALAIVGLTLASSAFGILSVASTAPGHSDGGSPGSEELVLAAASLRAGGGPALGIPILCSAVGFGSESCAARPLTSVSSTTGGNVWANLTALANPGPSGRLGAAMTWDPSDGYVLLYGGETVTQVAVADTWTFSNGTWTNITAAVAGTPPGLVGSSLAYFPATDKVILFGGWNRTGVSTNYTWAYHAKTWTNITTTVGHAPSPRIFPSLTLDSSDGQLLLFGGRNSAYDWQRDTWTFNGTWVNVTSLQPFAIPYIYSPALIDDPAGHGALLVGPMFWGPSSVHAGTFVFVAGAWENLTTSPQTQPPPLVYGAGSFLPSISGVVVFAAAVFNVTAGEHPNAVTWEFTNGAWANVTNLVGTSFDAVGGLAVSVALVPSDQTIIDFGGERVVVAPLLSSYTWALSAPPKVAASASKNVVDVGLSVAFTGSISGGLSPDSGKWSFGDGTLASGLSGSHAYAHAGIYTANFTATDFLDRNSTTSLTIFVNPAPSVSFALAPANPVAGSAVGFVPALTGGTAPFSYSWVFGDGSTSTAPAPSHTYSGSGSFTAKLTVTDAQGANATASLPVSVASAPSTAVSLTSGTGLFLLLGILLLLVIVVVLAILLARKPREPRAPAVAYSSVPPSGTTGPAVPPGAT